MLPLGETNVSGRAFWKAPHSHFWNCCSAGLTLLLPYNVPHTLLISTTSFNNGFNTQAAQRTQQHPMFIQVLNIAKDTCSIPPVQIGFGSASIFLTTICVNSLYPFKQTSDSHLPRT